MWGASEACVVVVSRGFDAVERKITLAIQLDQDSGECEGEYLLRFLWLTETILVGVCGAVIHLFDLANVNNEDSCSATAHFALAYEDILIRSAALTSDLSPSESKEVLKKLVLLLDNGRIHFLELYVNEDGSLGEEGKSCSLSTLASNVIQSSSHIGSLKESPILKLDRGLVLHQQASGDTMEENRAQRGLHQLHSGKGQIFISCVRATSSSTSAFLHLSWQCYLIKMVL